MSGDDAATPPSVLWAQRQYKVFLTICLDDCVNPKIEIKNDSVDFAGVGGVDKKPYKVTIQLYENIIPEQSAYAARDRVIEFVLEKASKNNEEPTFWPRLTKEKIKYHWLKVDFNKWKEESDSDDEQGEPDLSAMMKEMGDIQRGDTNRDRVVLEDSDSDDGDLPDLE